MNTLGEYTFSVRSYECGDDGAAFLSTICNYLQEAASLHAIELGFARTDFASRGENRAWVLTRLRIRMTRYPRWTETVRVVTFPRGGRKIVAYRDFELYVGAECLGTATSEWVVIDLDTRKIVPVPPHVYACANTERAPVLGLDPFSRLRWECRETSAPTSFVARRADIDLNGHVNNVHYVEWLVESLPPAVRDIADFEIVFKSETFAGERVFSESVEVEPGVWAAHVASADARDHVVACVSLRMR